MQRQLGLRVCVCVCPQGLIFVIDSNDPQRIKEAADELHTMVNSCFVLLHLLVGARHFLLLISEYLIQKETGSQLGHHLFLLC